MRTRLATVSILSVGLVTALTIGVTATLVLRAHEADLIDEVYWSADQLGAVIQRSTRYDMLGNRRESLHRQIEAVGQQEGIGVVRVFNKEGRIVFSSDVGEIGTAVDKQAEACDGCHAAGQPLERPSIDLRSRIFTDTGGERVLGVVRPIPNEPGCSQGECHAHGPGSTVLGVLDVTVSLAGVEERLAQGRLRLAGLAGLAIGAGSLILWWSNRRLVVRPVELLAAATHRVAGGDLDTRVPITGRHELGDLQRDFNRMVERLGEARAQIAQADKLASVGRLAAGVAHEINNPLTGVLTFASVLARDQALPAEARDDLQVIVRETKRCREIVKGMLDFARRTPARREPTDLNEVVRRAGAILMKQLSLGRVALNLDLEPALPLLDADANQLQQVVVNLLLNAADAVAEGGRIRVRTAVARVPARGSAPVRGARCPTGCDLMAPGVVASGHPSIRVLRRAGGSEARAHIDAVTGSFVEPGPEAAMGAIAEWYCPRCHGPLDAEPTCERCGAPTFSVRVMPRDEILWCARVGCGWTRWASEDALGQRPVAEILVEDDGRGISAEDRARLFEPFFSTKGTRGTGLGLSVSWGLVEEHGGWIEVESAPGEGSRFTIRLPLPAGTVPVVEA
jgi:two-component system NtrC family sensor kinase